MPNFNTPLNSVLNTVSKKGLCKIPGFLNQQEIEDIKNEMQNSFSTMATGDELCYPDETNKETYPFGKMCRVQRHDMENYPTMKAVFSQEWFSDLTDKYFQQPNQKMLQVFFSHEYLTPDEVEGETRNSVLHVDPYEALKFMLYITDCDENNGAFRYIEGSQFDGASARVQHSISGLLGDKYRLDKNEELSKKYSEKDVTYASAKAGSLLVFTTDIIHGGGRIKHKGSERLGVICHNRRK